MDRMINRAALFLMAFAMIAGMALAQNAPATAPTSRPAARGAGGPNPRNPDLPTLWLVGDSTVQDGASGGTGWGKPIVGMFDTSKINVVNRSRGGRSSRSYQVEGLWDQVLSAAKSGDFVLLQMGHNDGGDVANRNGRPSLPGVGDETQEITKADGSKETVHTYGWYMRKYVTDAKAKGIAIIICSSIPHAPREEVKPGEVETRFAQVGWAEEVAKSENVPFIPLNKMALSHFVGMPPQDVREKFYTPPGDGTHTNAAGAEINAKCVIEGLKALPDCPLAKYVKG